MAKEGEVKEKEELEIPVHGSYKCDPKDRAQGISVRVRNFEDGVGYSPSWRSDFANTYITLMKRAKGKGEEYDLPKEENDELIINYFSFIKLKSAANYPDYYQADEIDGINHLKGKGSMIKAMVIAGLSNAAIAEWFPMRELSVQLFVDLFFDVRRYLTKIGFLRDIIFPFVNVGGYEAITEDVHHERIMISTAFTQGWEGLQRLFIKNTKLTEVETIALEKSVHNSLAFQADLYGRHIVLNPLPRPCDMERFQMSSQTKAQAQQAESDKLNSHNAWFQLGWTDHIRPDSNLPEHVKEAHRVIAMEEAARRAMWGNGESAEEKIIALPTAPVPAPFLVKKAGHPTLRPLLFQRQGQR